VRVNRKYDLKGSTVDREASEKEKGKDLPTLKDNDFVKDGVKVIIGTEAREKLLDTLTADTGVSLTFLVSCPFLYAYW
jgi:1-phosphatidylinositol-5-phosphate 4-kinase